MAEDVNTQAMRALVESAESGTVTIPAGEFVLDRPLTIAAGVVVVGAEGTTLSDKTVLSSSFGAGPLIKVRRPQ